MPTSGPNIYIKKKLAAWEVKAGGIALTGKNLEEARTIFKDHISRSIDLVTFEGTFSNKRLVDGGYKVTLSCREFFTKLKVGEVIYLRPLDDKNISISRTER